jgi:hypothetical protein
MLFPLVLVAAFFITLNFNPRVLYSPQDFRDERYFVATVSGNRTSPFFTIRSDDPPETIRSLPQWLQATEPEQHEKEVLRAANEFSTIAFNLLSKDLQERRLSVVGFGMEGEGYFLFYYAIPNEAVHERHASEGTFILQVLRNESGRTLLKLIGKGVSSEDPAIVARRAYDIVENHLARSLDSAKFQQYLRSVGPSPTRGAIPPPRFGVGARVVKKPSAEEGEGT